MFLEAAGIVTRALAQWVGQLEGRKASRLVDVVRFAKIQTEAANAIVTGIPEGASAADKAKALETAQGMVEGARRDVVAAALEVGAAVPLEVLNAFQNFGTTATAIASALAAEARNTALGIVALGFLFLYFSRRG